MRYRVVLEQDEDGVYGYLNLAEHRLQGMHPLTELGR
jgi:hypothetical protein